MIVYMFGLTVTEKNAGTSQNEHSFLISHNSQSSNFIQSITKVLVAGVPACYKWVHSHISKI